jgi:uncharacterized protein YndB with AHSA1/START domain
VSGPFRLTVQPSGERDIVMTREFAAPRELVFDAWTRPELLRRWLLGPDGWVMDVCDVDPRPGGAYRYVWRKVATGATMGMGGVFREVVRPERLVATEKFDDPWYEGEAESTIVLVDRSGRTLLTNTVRYASAAARDGVLKSGMESGVAVSYDRLEQLLAA